MKLPWAHMQAEAIRWRQEKKLIVFERTPKIIVKGQITQVRNKIELVKR